ncbi:hypothetical protein EDB84DRAFT_1446757 [Lactarius hengduanensis]|nr:hypothetical protein EDB84DRAFT_1446757 [Lactarius hengduanensis]
MPGILNLQVLQAPPLFSHSFFHDTLHEQHWSEVLWIVTLSLPLRRRPLTTLGRPPPTAVAESQWGEPRSDAFGTDTRIAGSISSGPVLLPLVSVGEEEGGAGREWQACPSSGLGCGATVYMLALLLSSSYPIILVSGLEAPITLLHYLFLHCRPLTTLGCPPPTAVVESQWGEPCSDAFGTNARVAGSISLGPVLLPLWATVSTRRLLTVNPDLAPSVGSGKRKAGQGRAGAVSHRLSRVYCYKWAVHGDTVFKIGVLELHLI